MMCVALEPLPGLYRSWMRKKHCVWFADLVILGLGVYWPVCLMVAGKWEAERGGSPRGRHMEKLPLSPARQ